MRSKQSFTSQPPVKRAAGILLLLVMWIYAPGHRLEAQDWRKNSDTAFEVFKEAKLAVYRKEWLKAVTGLRDFENKFPRSSYRDDALYWMAYGLDKLGDGIDKPSKKTASKEKALRFLDRLITVHPESTWVDDAQIMKVRIAADLVAGGHAQYLTPIVKVLNTTDDSQTNLMAVALGALVRLDTERAVPYVEKLLEGTQNAALRSAIVFLLEQVQDPRLRELVRRSQMEKPRWLRKAEPVYPIEALRKRVSGKVTLEVVTDPAGNVIKAVAVDGPALLHDAAVRAALQWKHEPTPVDGKQISRVFTIAITFSVN